jgi:hypothetical protein
MAIILNGSCLQADWQALHHPHIQTIISGLRDVYLVPILDPSNPHFGVGSICILASLDGFFEYMELSPCSANEWLKKGRCSQWDTSKTKEDTDARGVEPLAGDAVFAEGLDTMLGIVDARYIQHCCPLLMVRSSEDACLYVLSGIRGPQLFCMQVQSFCILLWPFFHGKISAGCIGRHLIYLAWNH